MVEHTRDQYQHSSELFTTIIQNLQSSGDDNVWVGGDSFVWKPCTGSSLDEFDISGVFLEPERISRGTKATFIINARVKDAGWTGADGKGSVVDMAVRLGGVEVFTEQDSLCDVATCPIPTMNDTEFSITYGRTFPFYTPPGRYHMVMKGHHLGGGDDLFCVEIAFTVHFF